MFWHTWIKERLGNEVTQETKSSHSQVFLENFHTEKNQDTSIFATKPGLINLLTNEMNVNAMHAGLPICKSIHKREYPTLQLEGLLIV